jgi:hypothetical protein
MEALQDESNLRETNEDLSTKDQDIQPPNQPAKAVEPPGHLQEQQGGDGVQLRDSWL